MQIGYQAIGSVSSSEGFSIRVSPEWRDGLIGLEGFSHLVVFWHSHQGGWDPAMLRVPRPYRKAPDELGIFATRSPCRPNAICQTVVPVSRINVAEGTISCHYIDAADGSPVLDIKPWLACCERPAQPRSPDWCAHWPASIEESGRFDWAGEFLFG